MPEPVDAVSPSCAWTPFTRHVWNVPEPDDARHSRRARMPCLLPGDTADELFDDDHIMLYLATDIRFPDMPNFVATYSTGALS